MNVYASNSHMLIKSWNAMQNKFGGNLCNSVLWKNAKRE